MVKLGTTLDAEKIANIAKELTIALVNRISSDHFRPSEAGEHAKQVATVYRTIVKAVYDAELG